MTAVLDRSPRSARKAKGEGHSRRSEILEAAERIFVECGYEGATIRRIADEVGVSSTALYMHFRDKSEILVEICEELFENLIAVNTALLAEAQDPVVRVRRMLDAYVDFALSHPNVYRLVFCSPDAVLGPDKIGPIDKMGRRTYELFRAAVTEIHAAGRLCETDIEVAAQTSWAAAHGMLSLLLTRPRFHWADPQRLCSGLLDMVFRGLAVG